MEPEAPGPVRTATKSHADAVVRLRRAGCVFAENEAAALMDTLRTPAALERALRRREAGELIEHIIGRAPFAGVIVEVDRGVFIPRARAEPLASAASAHAERRGHGARVLDLGCGSGAIAAVVKHAVPAAHVVATDASPAAVETARRNGIRFGFEVHRGDWFAGLPASLRRRLDVVVAYLPHTPGRALRTLPRDRVDGEGLAAFAGGVDGLDPLRAVVAALPAWTAPGGVFLTLMAPEQVRAAAEVAAAAGWDCSYTPVDDDFVVTLTRRPPGRTEVVPMIDQRHTS